MVPSHARWYVTGTPFANGEESLGLAVDFLRGEKGFDDLISEVQEAEKNTRSAASQYRFWTRHNPVLIGGQARGGPLAGGALLALQISKSEVDLKKCQDEEKRAKVRHRLLDALRNLLAD